MGTEAIADALQGHLERMLTYNTRRGRLLSSWLEEIDKFYNLLINYRQELMELGILDDLQKCAYKMLNLATDEAEVIRLEAESTEQQTKELLEVRDETEKL